MTPTREAGLKPDCNKTRHTSGCTPIFGQTIVRGFQGAEMACTAEPQPSGNAGPWNLRGPSLTAGALLPGDFGIPAWPVRPRLIAIGSNVNIIRPNSGEAAVSRAVSADEPTAVFDRRSVK